MSEPKTRDAAAPELPKLSAFPYLAHDPDGPRLIGAECADCGKRVFPPAAVCPECMGETMKPLKLSREGKLYSYTVFHQGVRWIAPGYIAGYVDMPEGVRVFTHIDAKPEQLACDLPVVLKETPPTHNPEGWDVLTFKFVPK
jgi:uncharacterized OB-fold protein